MSNNKEDLEKLKKELENLKAYREQLLVDDSKEEKKESKEEEEKISDSIDIHEELAKIDNEIKEFEEEIKKMAKEYEESYKKLQAIIDEYTEKDANKLLSQEEIEAQREQYAALKLEENQRSIEIKNRIDSLKRMVSSLKGKKTKIENNVKKAEALGLSEEEFREITAAIKKTSVMNSILEKKGLMPIVEKPAKERTKEEKQALKEAKEEILKEIAEIKKANQDYSVLDAIEALYSLDNTYKSEENPKEFKLKPESLDNLKKNAQDLTYRIIDSNIAKQNYKPEEAPKDMEGAINNEQDQVDINDLKPAEERVTVFKDTNTNDYYARKYAVQRFKLNSADIGNEVKINGSSCYKISEEDVEKIKTNANNALSPYIADVKEITLENEKTSDNSTPTIDNSIKEEDTKDELIPGTNIKKPRDRQTYETDEEYEAFLKGYYDKVFAEQNNEQKDGVQEDLDETKAIERITIFKDKESGNYYVRKYVVDRFKIDSADTENEIRIDGSLCNKINVEDVEKLVNNQENALSPYMADIKEISLGKDKEQKEDLNKEDIKEAIDESLKENKEKKEEKETTEDKCKAKNIKASDKFKKELKEGKFLYNIIIAIPTFFKKVGKAIKDFFKNENGISDEALEEMLEEAEETKVQEESNAKSK